MFNFRIKKTEKTILKWSILPAVLYAFVCYFKIQNNTNAFYLSLGMFVIFLILLFYKIYNLYKKD